MLKSLSGSVPYRDLLIWVASLFSLLEKGRSKTNRWSWMRRYHTLHVCWPFAGLLAMPCLQVYKSKHPPIRYCTGSGQDSSKPSSHITAVQLSSASHFPALGCSRKFIEDIANIDWGCFLSNFMLLTEGVILSLRWHGTARTPNNSSNESQAEVGLCTDRFINGFPMWCMFTEL